MIVVIRWMFNNERHRNIIPRAPRPSISLYTSPSAFVTVGYPCVSLNWIKTRRELPFPQSLSSRPESPD
ncbi:uncharacterized protein LOC143212903 [Lasioglossum baleicum]|uniref:uncharacterized protein LOC143212903 n=1 Tax=Lasioglossum baleicum TaxID=434251 RepID=UPI003FCE9A9D